MLKAEKTPHSRLAVVIDSLEDTARLGSLLAQVLRPGMALLMKGSLGAGKTTLVRELCRALGWKRTCSPTFALVNEYARARIPVAHADLYRVDQADGRDFGFDDYLDDGWILIIEWPERLIREDFAEVWRCTVDVEGERRVFSVDAEGPNARAALDELGELIHE